ncbi:MAG: putative Ig domain-containing protein, partial [Planctomycetes bacterium]|nr:putative Ig domain-containing protein [Planctomycetota bacterium]
GTPAPGSSANSPYIIDVAFHDSSPELFGLTVYNVEIEVLPPILSATTSLAPAEEGVAYPATQLQITGGTGPYTFGNTSGLPMGMNIDSDGMLSGTPSCAAVENGPSYTVSFDVTDSTSPPVTVPCTITLDVLGPSLAIDTATLADAYEGEPYSVLLAASGMSAAITWNVEGLPAGLNAGRIGGMWQIIGTPAVGSAGGYAVTLTLEESDGFSSHELSVPLPLNVVEPANATGLRVLTSYLPDAREGEAYTRQTIRASGGSGQYAFTISGLAPGMTDGPGTSGTHWIGGTPEAAGQYVVIIAVEDSIMGDRTSKALALVVSPAAAETGDVAVIHDGANVDLVGGAGCAMGQSRATYVWLLGLAVLAGVFALRRRSVFGT